MADEPLEMTRCQHCKTYRASGIFSVLTRRHLYQEMKLCAECGFWRVIKRVKVFYPKDEDKPVVYHDVVSVKLIRSI